MLIKKNLLEIAKTLGVVKSCIWYSLKKRKNVLVSSTISKGMEDHETKVNDCITLNCKTSSLFKLCLIF